MRSVIVSKNHYLNKIIDVHPLCNNAIMQLIACLDALLLLMANFLAHNFETQSCDSARESTSRKSVLCWSVLSSTELYYTVLLYTVQQTFSITSNYFLRCSTHPIALHQCSGCTWPDFGWPPN